MKRKCIVCGKEFESRGIHHIICGPECLRKYKCAYSRLFAAAVKAGKPNPTAEEVAAFAKTYKPRKYKRNAVRAARGGHPCPFCGKPTRGVYCAYCEKEGFAEVHRTTGRTNGWEKKASTRGKGKGRGQDKPRGKAIGGWRGRPCAGGYTPKSEITKWLYG